MRSYLIFLALMVAAAVAAPTPEAEPEAEADPLNLKIAIDDHDHLHHYNKGWGYSRMLGGYSYYPVQRKMWMSDFDGAYLSKQYLPSTYTTYKSYLPISSSFADDNILQDRLLFKREADLIKGDQQQQQRTGKKTDNKEQQLHHQQQQKPQQHHLGKREAVDIQRDPKAQQQQSPLQPQQQQHRQQQQHERSAPEPSSASHPREEGKKSLTDTLKDKVQKPLTGQKDEKHNKRDPDYLLSRMVSSPITYTTNSMFDQPLVTSRRIVSPVTYSRHFVNNVVPSYTTSRILSNVDTDDVFDANNLGYKTYYTNKVVGSPLMYRNFYNRVIPQTTVYTV